MELVPVKSCGAAAKSRADAGTVMLDNIINNANNSGSMFDVDK
jgi:hypothetical protein